MGTCRGDGSGHPGPGGELHQAGCRPQGIQELHEVVTLALADDALCVRPGQDVDEHIEGADEDECGFIVADGPVDSVERLLYEVGNALEVGAVAAASGGCGGLVVVHVVPPPAPGC